MPSNTTLNSGTGGDIITTKERTHDGDATKQQVVSLAFATGTEGAYTHTDAIAGAGAVTAGVQRVTLASDDPAVVALQLLDNAISGAGYNITQLNGVNVSMGAGAVGTGVQRTTLSSDDPAVVALQLIDNAVSGTGFNVSQLNGVAVTMGNGASGTGVQRVTLANDSTGVIAAVTNVATIGTSVTPGTSAAHLGKAADAVAGATDTGVAILAIRDDTLTTLTPADGDYAPLRVSSTGALHVTGSAGTTQYTEDGASAGGESLCLMGAVRRDSAASSSGTDGDYSTLNTDATGNLRVSVSAGGVAGVVEDAVASGTAEGILSVVVRDDALATLTPVDGDYTSQRVNARGATWVALDSTAAQTVTLAAGTATNEVVGDAAHDAAIAGNPVRIGARAMSADITAVATGDTTDVLATLTGKLVTTPYALPGSTWNYAAASGGLTNTTAVTIKAAGAAGVRNYLTSIQVINGHATVSTEVLVRDGAAGTVLHRGWAQAAGGGFAALFDPPLRGTAATLLEAVNVTTGSAVYVNAQGFSAAE